MKYKVEINYYDFVFDNAEEAIHFADTAVKAFRSERDRDIEVTITLIRDNENKEEE